MGADLCGWRGEPHADHDAHEAACCQQVSPLRWSRGHHQPPTKRLLTKHECQWIFILTEESSCSVSPRDSPSFLSSLQRRELPLFSFGRLGNEAWTKCCGLKATQLRSPLKVLQTSLPPCGGSVWTPYGEASSVHAARWASQTARH